MLNISLLIVNTYYIMLINTILELHKMYDSLHFFSILITLATCVLSLKLNSVHGCYSRMLNYYTNNILYTQELDIIFSIAYKK